MFFFLLDRQTHGLSKYFTIHSEEKGPKKSYK